jgi:small subunit ribosomal protein S5e
MGFVQHLTIIRSPLALYPSQSVDVSPFRRVNQALYLLTTGAREASFRNVKTIAECLADELINAAKGSSNSYAIKKKDEIERVAKANR